jgi:hypothetical protein
MWSPEEDEKLLRHITNMVMGVGALYLSKLVILFSCPLNQQVFLHCSEEMVKF